MGRFRYRCEDVCIVHLLCATLLWWCVRNNTTGAHQMEAPQGTGEDAVMRESLTLYEEAGEDVIGASPSGLPPPQRAEVIGMQVLQSTGLSGEDALQLWESRVAGRVVMLANPQREPRPSAPTTSHVTRRQSRRRLSRRQRKAAGLNRLEVDREWLYAHFEPLHELWLAYARQWLPPPSSWPPSQRTLLVLSERIARGDLHGALVEVIRARNPSLVGLRGIVVLEHANMFQIVTPADQLKMVPKRGCMFSLKLDPYEVKLMGDQMCQRPTERAVRKWTARVPVPL